MKQLTAATLVFLIGCSGPVDTPVPTDVGSAAIDVGQRHDAAITPDAGWDAQVDLAIPVDAEGGAFGDISGECEVLDTELTDASPWLFQNAIDFGMDPYDDSDLDRLTEGGQEIIADGNAGGNSLLSEVFAYEMLARCEGAVLLKTETEIAYVDPMGKITDLLVDIDGAMIGVSVTRAVGFPREDPYTFDQATMLLTDKLDDIEASSANVADDDRWTKQILHVIAYAEGHAESLRTAYDGLSPDVVDDTIVIVTVSDGDDAFLY